MKRAFHPRHSLEDMSADGGYGVIVNHYIYTGSQSMSPLAQQTVKDPSVITSSRVSIERACQKFSTFHLAKTYPFSEPISQDTLFSNRKDHKDFT